MVKSGARLIACVKSEMAPLTSPVLATATPRLRYAVARSLALARADAMIVVQAIILSLGAPSLHWRYGNGGSAAPAAMPNRQAEAITNRTHKGRMAKKGIPRSRNNRIFPKV